MAPKKGKKGPNLIDGVDTSQMSREQLEAFALKLKNEMDREREERNFFQLERDKLRTFWEITREQLEEANAKVRNKDRLVEVTNEETETNIKHTIQQMKHLQYETNTKIGELRAETMAQIKLAQEEHDKQEQELLRDKRELRRLLRERDEIHDLQTQQLRSKQCELLREEQNRFYNEAQEIITLNEKKIEAQNTDTQLLSRMEMFEVEERKNYQISKLLESHDAAFSEMKNYYNDITLNNLALISSLKEQMDELRRQEERQERIANETLVENKRMVEPLQQAQDELADLRNKLQNYNRDKVQLEKIKKKLTKAAKDLNAFKWETETLVMRNDTLAEERDQLKNKFEEGIMELQRKTGLKNVLLERKVEMLESEAEAREALLNEALMASGLDPAKIGLRIDNLLQAKNETILDLKYELTRVCKAHDDLLATYEIKLKRFGIPKEELGFEPLRTVTRIKYGAGPAGLVTKNK